MRPRLDLSVQVLAGTSGAGLVSMAVQLVIRMDEAFCYATTDCFSRRLQHILRSFVIQMEIAHQTDADGCGQKLKNYKKKIAKFEESLRSQKVFHTTFNTYNVTFEYLTQFNLIILKI